MKMAVSEIARCPSADLSLASNSPDICRICHCEGSLELPLLSPCYCSGSLKYVHQACLQQWIKSSNNTNCELCKFQFIMQTRFKRLSEWEYLEMTGMERKKLCFAMLFHLVAMTCVCWSLYVLIDRTMDEIKKGNIEWPFWTKLIVVGIGFMGGVIFMYIQCKAYVILCGRWKSYNRVIFIQNAPPKHPVKRIEPGNVDRVEKECLTAGQSTARTSCNNVDTKDGCIDIKGVRNLRIYLDDDHRITVHKNEPCCSSNIQNRYDDIDRETPSWKIQIDENSSLYNWDSADSNSKEAQSIEQDCALELPSDKVVKVQIQHKDVVIEFENNRRNDQEYIDDDRETCRKMMVNTTVKPLLQESRIIIEEWSSKDDLLSDTVETSRNTRANILKESSLDTRSIQSV